MVIERHRETTVESGVHSGTGIWLLTGTGAGRTSGKARQILAVRVAHGRLSSSVLEMTRSFFSCFTATPVEKGLVLGATTTVVEVANFPVRNDLDSKR